MLPRLNRPRVFMTTDAVGGVWRYAVDLARGLDASGWAVTLAVLGPSPDDAQRAEVDNFDLRVTDLRLDWIGDAASVIECGRAIAAMAQGADIVHLNSPALAADTVFHAPLIIACHSCVATWWDAVRDDPLPNDFRWRRDMVARGYAKADRLVAPSRAFAAATHREYGVRPSVVHNGRIAGASSTAAPGDIVFTAGRLWDEGKNLRLLDQAAALLDAPILAAGSLDGPNGTRIDLPNLRTLGRLDSDAVVARLAARPVFASAARYEPFGLAVLEAAQSGCALVLSDIDSFREIWGDAAEYVSGDNPQLWANAFARLLGDPVLRASRGKTAQERAARYTVDAMVAGTVALYRELLPARAEVAA